MLIRNYGLFWKRDTVFWGRQKNPGHLKGVHAKKLKAKPVDFRNQQGVYVLYDDNFRIIYMGQAGASDQQKLFIRLRQHKKDHLAQRWSRFSWFGIIPAEDGVLKESKVEMTLSAKSALDHIEAVLIAAAEPPLNLQRGRFGENVDQYLQFVEGDEEEEE